MRKRLNLKSMLWITDPWDTLDHAWDTSLRLMREGFALGVSQYWTDVRSIRLDGHHIFLEAHKLRSDFKLDKPFRASPSDFSQLHYRPDPPVNQIYLHPLQLLNLAAKQGKPKFEVVNPLSVLCTSNEKMEAALLKPWMPSSTVSSQWEYLIAFGKKQGVTVLKPLNDAQSHGIQKLIWKTPSDIAHSKQAIRDLSQNFTCPVILQAYLEGILEGETRLWFADGKLIAHVKKLPLSGDFKINIDQGSQVIPTSLTTREKRLVSPLSKHLKRAGIRLAALDVIDGFITDFNFTSPGLIPKMEACLKENLALPIIQTLCT